jgi:hypothetical protein
MTDSSANRIHYSQLFNQHHLVGYEPVIDDLIVLNFIANRKRKLHIFISREECRSILPHAGPSVLLLLLHDYPQP